MRKFISALCLALIMICTCSYTQARAQTQKVGIAITVNEDAISYLDIFDRTNLIIASAGMPNTPETREKLLPQIINSLIDERLQFQEAQRLGLKASPVKIDQEFANIAKSNKMSAADFKARLEKGNVSAESLRTQIEARLIWGEVFSNSLRRKVRVSEADIVTYRRQLENHVGKTEYLLSEIFLPVTGTKERSKVLQLANSVVRDLKAKKTSFANVARQLSKSAGAENGGALGWVLADQLEGDIQKSIARMAPKTLSDPLRTADGYRIYYLSDKRSVSRKNLPNDGQIRQKLFADRADRIAYNHLKSLRYSAFIDNRLDAQ